MHSSIGKKNQCEGKQACECMLLQLYPSTSILQALESLMRQSLLTDEEGAFGTFVHEHLTDASPGKGRERMPRIIGPKSHWFMYGPSSCAGSAVRAIHEHLRVLTKVRATVLGTLHPVYTAALGAEALIDCANGKRNTKVWTNLSMAKGGAGTVGSTKKWRHLCRSKL
jgi:hypothetical protein